MLKGRHECKQLMFELREGQHFYLSVLIALGYFVPLQRKRASICYNLSYGANCKIWTPFIKRNSEETGDLVKRQEREVRFNSMC